MVISCNFYNCVFDLVNVPTAIVSQRQSAVVSSQTIPIASVYSQQGENQQGPTPTANVFIHTPLSSVPRRTSPSEWKSLFKL
jgi:hypothetical protein